MVQVLNVTFWVTGLSASLIGALCLAKYGRVLLEAKRDAPGKPRDERGVAAPHH